jgi:hypothetical protein
MAASVASGTATYSARVPSPVPNTWSPGRKRATFGPAASTSPARSIPSRPPLGRRSPIAGRASHGMPVIAYQSAGLTDAALTRTRTSPSAASGRSTWVGPAGQHQP